LTGRWILQVTKAESDEADGTLTFDACGEQSSSQRPENGRVVHGHRNGTAVRSCVKSLIPQFDLSQAPHHTKLSGTGHDGFNQVQQVFKHGFFVTLITFEGRLLSNRFP
tara:strand:+ start:251 stop:577 length:327 start_codon:yes stop_codon:yes gene_type:complete